MTDHKNNEEQLNIQHHYTQDSPVNNTVVTDINASKSENLQDYINCAIAIRAAMAQLRLYPPQSATVRLALNDAIAFMNDLWSKTKELLITNNGTDIGVNGLGLPRQSARMLSDMQRIMNDAGITAIAYKTGVTESEVEKFLVCLGTYNSDLDNTPFNIFFDQLGISNIEVAMKGHAKSIAELSDAAAALASGKSIISGTESGIENNGTGEKPIFNESDESMELESLNQADWEVYLKQYVNSAPLIRRKILAALAKWLDSHFEVLTNEDAKRIDPFITEVIMQEPDASVVTEAIGILAHRMQDLIDDGTMDKALELVKPVKDKLEKSESPELRANYSKVVDKLVTNVNLLELAQKSSYSPDDFTHASNVIEALGKKSYKMIIDLLTNNNNMQDRAMLLEFIRSILPTHLPDLYLELRKPQIWFVYRTLLEILNGYVSESQLAVVSEKIEHSDYRVREQALITAVTASGENAQLYIMRGLKDDNATVRARAASLISVDPQPELLEYLVKILSGKSGRNETEEVLMASCLSLRFFDCDEARDLLLKLLYPPFLSPFRKMSNEVRSVAVVALANSIDKADVEIALRKAATDTNILVRQNAKQALAGK
jgi:hypothetical protein